MKRILILLAILFCDAVYADTINLDWYVDGNSYAQTTCEIGSGVTLPTEPTKYGYDFIGWSEIFNRGTFANWASVPTGASGYTKDANDNKTPKENDYMVVSDSSDYTSLGEEIVFERIEPRQDGTYLKVIYKGYETYFPSGGAIRYLEPNNTIGAYTTGTPTTIYLKSYSAGKIIFNGITYNENVYIKISDDIGGMNVGDKIIAYTEGRNDKLGTWRFKYSGNWDSVGKSGWIPEKSLD